MYLINKWFSRITRDLTLDVIRKITTIFILRVNFPKLTNADNLKSLQYFYNAGFLFLLISNIFAQKIVPDSTYSWYFEDSHASVYNITMLTDSTGFATSRGLGRTINGYVLKYSRKKWEPIREYEYSDFPALYVSTEENNLFLLAMNHLTHNGDYKPLMKYYDGTNWSLMNLPQIMWDKKDYVMFFSLSGNHKDNIWAVGQKGYLIHYNGHKWSIVDSPLKWQPDQNYYEEDLLGITVFNDDDAWACGYGGKILHYSNGKWTINKLFPEMTNAKFYDIFFLDKNNGIAVGEKGAIAIYKNGQWKIQFINNWTFNSLKVFKESDYWIAGSNGKKVVLLHYLQDKISICTSLNSLKVGSIYDLDGFKTTSGYDLWLATSNGIMRNRKEETVTFSNVTSEANLPARGRAGVFFDLDNDEDSDILILPEGGIPYRGYTNDGKGNFTNFALPAGIKSFEDISGGIAIGDIENDGIVEILLTGDKNQLVLLKQTSPLNFKIKESRLSKIKLTPNTWSTTKFWDINRDGYVDLFYGNGTDGLSVLLNDGYGEFVDSIKISIKTKKDSKLIGITLYDVNVDGLTDILLIYNDAANELWLNKNNYHFDQLTDNNIQGLNGEDPFIGVFTDFDNDRWPDLYIYKRGASSNILFNLQPRRYGFSKGPAIEKLTHYYWENGIVSAGDVNNDYFNDLYISNSLWINNQGKSFENISGIAQMSFEGNSIMEDFDNDGDLDILLGNLSGASGMTNNLALYKNNLENNKSIKIKFDCFKNNRFGIGSWIWLYEDSKDDNDKILCTSKYVGFEGNPLSTENFFPITIPVKENKKYNISIRFPDGNEKKIYGILPGESIHVHDLVLMERLFAKFNWYLSFSLHYANFYLEFLKLILFVLALFWLLLKYKYVHSLNSSLKYTIVASISIIYIIAFIFTGLYPLSIENPGVHLMIIAGITIGPYLTALIVEKHRMPRISHYKIIDLIGEGGMGKVYKAKDSKINKIVALKILNPGVTESEDGIKRFQRESKIGIELIHKNIIRLYETGVQDGQCFLAMEYLEGKTLKQLIREKGKFSAKEIVKISKEIIKALSEIHKNHIVHRDVKSENVFVTNNEEIKLMDFGLAKSAIFTAATKTNEIIGTLAYMSPQQAVGENVDRRSDIYSLGVIMYELATGRLPFSGDHDMAVVFKIFKNNPEPITKTRADFSTDLEKCIFIAMSKEVEDRYQTCGEFMYDLNNLNL